MSDFIGPNVYTVVTRLVDKRLDLDGGKKEDGTKLQLLYTSPESRRPTNEQWLTPSTVSPMTTRSTAQTNDLSLPMLAMTNISLSTTDLAPT